jgi:diguanylate cyclase (GGDEF)-like protein/PAS domain S-box-containing protein
MPQFRHSIRFAALLGTLLLSAVFAGVSTLVALWGTNSFAEEQEKQTAAAALKDTVLIMEDSLRHLGEQAQLLAWSNRLYNLLYGGNSGTAELPAAIVERPYTDFQAIVLLDQEGRFLFGRTVFARRDAGVQPDTRLPAPLRAYLETLVPRIHRASPQSGTRGLARIHGELHMLAAVPVLTARMEGPAAGWLALLRKIDEPYIQQLSARSGLRLQLHENTATALPAPLVDLAAIRRLGSAAPPVVTIYEGDTYAGTVLPELKDGLPVAVTGVRVNSLTHIIRQILAENLLLTVPVALAAFMAGFILLDRRVLKRISSLVSAVRASGSGVHAAVRPSGSELDELEMLLSAATDTALRNERDTARIMDSLPVGLMVIDPKTRAIVSLNRAAQEMLGFTEDGLLGRDCSSVVCLATDEPCPMLDTVNPQHHVIRTMRRADRTEITALKSTAHINDGRNDFFMEAFMDITDLERKWLSHRNEAQRLSAAFAGLPAPVTIMDSGLSIIQANKAFWRMTGAGHSVQNEITPLSRFIHPEDLPLLAGLDRSASGVSGVSGDAVAELKLRMVDASDTVHFVLMRMTADAAPRTIVYEDLTARQHYEEERMRQAYTDHLTGLPNRQYLYSAGLEKMAGEAAPEQSAGLCLINIQGLDVANNAAGLAAGDAVLLQAAQRMDKARAADHTLIRYGGDDFLIVMPAPCTADAMKTLAEKLHEAFETPFMTGGTEYTLQLSFGFALYPEHGDTLEELIRRADMAMCHSRFQADGQFCLYHKSLDTLHQYDAGKTGTLRTALENGEFLARYQPVVDLRSGTITGAEALARQVLQNGHESPPAGFKRSAERSGIIWNIDLTILQQACRDAARWHTLGMPAAIAVNISPAFFHRHDFLAHVEAALKDSGLPAGLLTLDMEEAVYLHDYRKALGTLDSLKHMGVRPALGNFGTGYSATAHLHDLGFAALKIDHTIASALPGAPAAALLRSAAGVAGSLDIPALSGGVETEFQRSFLLGLGYAAGQGFLFAPPLPAAQMEKLFTEQPRFSAARS